MKQYFLIINDNNPDVVKTQVESSRGKDAVKMSGMMMFSCPENKIDSIIEAYVNTTLSYNYIKYIDKNETEDSKVYKFKNKQTDKKFTVQFNIIPCERISYITFLENKIKTQEDMLIECLNMLKKRSNKTEQKLINECEEIINDDEEMELE